MNPKYWSLDTIHTHLLYGCCILQSLERKIYTPPFSLKGKTVLDVGAYIGDSARFFKGLGASKIICIEPHYAEKLRHNAAFYHLPVEIIEECFSLKHLSMPHDFMKVDIEGYEETLLGVSPADLKPTIMEVHGHQLIDHFLDKGWSLVSRQPRCGCCGFINNYNSARV